MGFYYNFTSAQEKKPNLKWIREAKRTVGYGAKEEAWNEKFFPFLYFCFVIIFNGQIMGNGDNWREERKLKEGKERVNKEGNEKTTKLNLNENWFFFWEFKG